MGRGFLARSSVARSSCYYLVGLPGIYTIYAKSSSAGCWAPRQWMGSLGHPGSVTLMTPRVAQIRTHTRQRHPRPPGSGWGQRLDQSSVRHCCTIGVDDRICFRYPFPRRGVILAMLPPSVIAHRSCPFPRSASYPE
eukprot:scaffold795_cov375-Prasinococcus_capsulatus_cf.AAC.31